MKSNNCLHLHIFIIKPTYRTDILTQATSTKSVPRIFWFLKLWSKGRKKAVSYQLSVGILRFLSPSALCKINSSPQPPSSSNLSTAKKWMWDSRSLVFAVAATFQRFVFQGEGVQGVPPTPCHAHTFLWPRTHNLPPLHLHLQPVKKFPKFLQFAELCCGNPGVAQLNLGWASIPGMPGMSPVSCPSLHPWVPRGSKLQWYF